MFSHTIMLGVRVLGFPQQTITRFVVFCWGASPHFSPARQDFEGAIRQEIGPDQCSHPAWGAGGAPSLVGVGRPLIPTVNLVSQGQR